MDLLRPCFIYTSIPHIPFSYLLTVQVLADSLLAVHKTVVSHIEKMKKCNIFNDLKKP